MTGDNECMAISQPTKRLLVSLGLVTAGLITGLGLYLCVMFAMAAAGFYTLSFGTGSFVALFICLLTLAAAAIAARRDVADDDTINFHRKIRTFLLAMIALQVVLCIFFIAFMPKTVLFLPHG